jgi:outer membrane murein-binding lipoprotein Lpp
MPAMRCAAIIFGLLLLAGCKGTPEVDLGAPADAAVNTLSSRQLALGWRRSVKAAAEVVGPKEYCRFHAIFTRYERNLDREGCVAAEAACVAGGGSLRDVLDPAIAEAFGAACGVRVGDLEVCLNDALKVADTAATKIDCGDDPVSIDRKLPVPKTCDVIRDGCIIPVLVYLLRRDAEEEE